MGRSDRAKKGRSSESSSEMDSILAQTLNMESALFHRNGSTPSHDLQLSENIWRTDLKEDQPMEACLFDPFHAASDPFHNVLSASRGSASQLVGFDPSPMPPLPSQPPPPALQTTVPQTGGILSWGSDSCTAAGYIEGHDCSIIAMLQASRFSSIALSLAQGSRSKPTLPICKASRNPIQSDVIVVGTASKSNKDHAIIAVNAGLLLNTSDPAPDELVLSVSSCPEHVQELHWITPNTVVVAHNSNATVYNISPEFELKRKSSLQWAHTDELRELAFDPKRSNVFVSGGFDQTLCLNDLNKGSLCTTSAVRLDEVIGSVSWNSYESHCVAMTTDDGRFFQFDTRIPLRKASLFIDAQKLCLYTHSIYQEHHVLLGFGDGEIMQVDTRRSLFVDGVKDPFVDTIGDIVFTNDRNRFLVSGQSDFSLWKFNPYEYKAQIWSHCNATKSQASEFYTNAIFGADPGTVIKTDELGIIGVYQHEHI